MTERDIAIEAGWVMLWLVHVLFRRWPRVEAFLAQAVREEYPECFAPPERPKLRLVVNR